MRIFIISLGLLALTACNNPFSTGSSNQSVIQLDTTQWNKMHSTFKESALYHRRFKHQEVDSLIKAHQKSQVFDISEIGQSVQGRSIYEVVYGEGEKKVMLWSQMHGDEPTATMALFDIFNFLEGSQDGFDSLRTILKTKLNLHFIPMLNPDGAQ